MRLRPLIQALFALAFLGWLSAGTAARAGTPVAVAAAGDLRGALEEVKAAFEARRPGVSVQVSFGASGSLTAQILQGAPFDLFLSADSGFPEQVRQAGRGTGMPFAYATGSLTLWVRRDLGLDPAQSGLAVLTHPSVKKIATANPQTAPYGRAGDAALRAAGLYETVKARLVFADNIAQAAQFLQTGGAEAGLVSASQARHPVLQQTGLAWTVPAGLYPALRQAGILLAGAAHPAEAQAFRDFLLGPEGQAILARHGFGKP